MQTYYNPNTLRDREGSLESQLLKKHQRRLTAIDHKFFSLYATGMSTREIVETFQEMYGAEASPAPVNRVTDSVMERDIKSQSRAVEEIYPNFYLDRIVVKSHKTTLSTKRFT